MFRRLHLNRGCSLCRYVRTKKEQTQVVRSIYNFDITPERSGDNVIEIPHKMARVQEKRRKKFEEKKQKWREQYGVNRGKARVLISCKRSEYNHYDGQAYPMKRIPLVSEHWTKPKYVGDYFVVNSFGKNPSVLSSRPEDGPTNFDGYGLCPEVVSAIKEMGYKRPTLIQHFGIAACMTRKNILLAAETGSGKTLAYAAALVHHLIKAPTSPHHTTSQTSTPLHARTDVKFVDEDDYGTAENVVESDVEDIKNAESSDSDSNSTETDLSSTDERNTLSAFEEEEEFTLADAESLKFSPDRKVVAYPRAMVLTPGRELATQTFEMIRQDADVLVGTPGILERLERFGVLGLDGLSEVIVDEADTLLDDSFSNLIIHLLSKVQIQVMTPGMPVVPGAQLVLSSATFPRDLETILEGVIDSDNITHVKTTNLHRVLPHVPQKFWRLSEPLKREKVLDLVKTDVREGRSVLVFARDQEAVDWVFQFLTDHDVECGKLRGRMSITRRQETFDKFQRGELKVLVASDIASRGLDTSSPGHVTNFVQRKYEVGMVNVIEAQQPNHDELYILIDNAEIHKCKGVPNNKIHINKEDIYISDTAGNQLYFIRAPGEININFRKITLSEPLPHLSGEISALLQVPLVQGPLISFDFPYPVIPEKTLLSDRCDSHSGVVKKILDGRERLFCRYCDLCQTSAHIEQGLNRGHKYLPGLGKTNEELEFSRFCNRLDARTYSLKRTVRLPGRTELERQVRQNFGGVGSEIKRRFDKGRGKFEVKLNLLSGDKEPQTSADFYNTSPQCRCCNPQRRRDISCLLGQIFSCNQEDCKSQWAQQCIANEEVAACYTTVFNYRVTTNWNEVRQFMARIGTADHLRPKPGRGQLSGKPSRPPPHRPSPTSPRRPSGRVPNVPSHPRPVVKAVVRQPGSAVRPPGGVVPPLRRTKQPRPAVPRTRPPSRATAPPATRAPTNVQGGRQRASLASGDSGKRNCIAAMPDKFKRLRKYCEKFWNTGFCCPRCPKECPNFKYQ